MTTEQTDDTLYPQIKNDNEYGPTILIVRLGMILHALRLVTHTIPLLVQKIQTHNVHIHVITYHNN